MRIIGIVLCLLALGLTGYSALTHKAPKIQADIETRAIQAVSAVADDNVDIRVDGRHVTLSGEVADDERRSTMLNAVAALPGALGPVDALERAKTASPYRFDVVKNEDGRVTIDGMAPSQETKEAITAEAMALFGDEVDVDIEIAAGAPPALWQNAAISSLDAIATMRRGKLSIADSDIALEGAVTTEADVGTIDMFAETMPEGFTWTHDVGVQRERVEPFTFSVVKNSEDGLRLDGFAPDEETRAAFIERGKAIGGDRPVIADVRIADGMPDEEWPSLVIAGIDAMKDMEAGRYDVAGNDVSFAVDHETSAAGKAPEATSTPKTDAARNADGTPADAASETENAGLFADGSVDAALTPPADEPERQTPALTIDKVDDGVWSMRGLLPDQNARDRLVALVGQHAGGEEVEVEVDVILADGTADDDWLRFAADRVPTLDEVRAGRLNLDDFDAHLIGVVETPEDIEPVQTAIAAVDRNMTVDLQPIDPRPIASLDLALSMDDGVVLNGNLPQGLSEGEAMLALGVRRYEGKLEVNGRGRAEKWRRDLSTIGDFLPIFERVDLALGGERPAIDGRVHAHGDAEAIADRLTLALGADKEPLVNVETTTATYDEGARRTNPLTGDEEIHRRGYWIPVIEIGADAEVCSERAEALQTTDKITFGRGQEDLDHRALAALNELAGLAIACIDRTDLVLEIGGHTDSRGATEMNERLSRTRADAVRDALAARGVDAGAMVAVGYGDKQPIADNATGEGRAANRRITFEWKTSADGRG